MAWMYRLVPKLPKAIRPSGMIILNHTGRRSGQPRVTGLQQIHHDPESGAYFVAAAYGPTSDWWLNAIATPTVTIETDGYELTAEASVVPEDQAIEVMTAAIRDDERLRGRVFKHAGVDPSEPDALSQIVNTNPLMAFTTGGTARP